MPAFNLLTKAYGAAKSAFGGNTSTAPEIRKKLRAAGPAYGPPAPAALPYSPERKFESAFGKTPKAVESARVSTPVVAAPPSGFDYSKYSAPASPSTANTAKVDTSYGAGMDPRIQEMMKKTYDQSSYGNATVGTTAGTDVGTAGGTTGGVTNGAGTVTPNIVSLARKNLEKLRQQVQGLSATSEQERQLADQLAQFQGSAAQGIAGLEGQGRGIPLGLVRGQQGLLEKQAALGEQTLLARLSAAEQARQSKLAAAQLGLGFAEQDLTAEQEAAKAGQPIEIGGALVQLNPQTGQYETVYQAPEASAEAQKPITVSAGQTVIDPTTGQVIFQAGDKPEAIPSSVQEYLFATQQGYTGDYNSFKNQSAAQKVPSAEMLKLQSNVQSGIDSLSTLETLLTQNQGVFGRPLLASGTYKAAEQNLIDVIGRLRSGGAITAEEADRFKTLLPQRLETQQTVEYKLGQLRSLLEGTLAASPESGGGDDIDQFLDSFSGVPSTTQNGSAQAIANAIKQVESGGNYQARGGSGETGAFQFMPATWKSWAGKYLGNSDAPLTPENQDKVAVSRIQEWLDQGYTPEMIALSWNAGSPVRRSGVNKYGVRYDSGAYADKVLRALG